MAIRGTKIILLNEEGIEGPYGSTISNTSADVWDMGGATLENLTIVGYEQFGLPAHSLWVDPLFTDTNPFFTTIQDAIDACTDASVDNRYVINVLPGNYDGFIIDTYPYITVKGHGKVDIGTLNSTGESIIQLKDTNNCHLENLIITDQHYNFNAVSPLYTIELENSSATFKNLLFSFEDQTKTSDYIFSFIKLGASGKSIKIEDVRFFFANNCGANFPNETFKGIDFIDATDALGLEINNAKFRIVQTNHTAGGSAGEFTVIESGSSNTEKYFMKIFNTQVELDISSNAGTVESVIGGNSLDKIIVNNSCSNTNLDIDIIAPNVLEDSDYKLTSE